MAIGAPPSWETSVFRRHALSMPLDQMFAKRVCLEIAPAKWQGSALISSYLPLA